MRVTCSLPMSPLGSSDELHKRVERYYDAVPRARSAAEDVGPFTLFVATHGWPYYARPRLGGGGAFTLDDVRALLDRQAELGVPRSIEWMHDVTPELLDIASDAVMTVDVCPLLVLDGEPRGHAPTLGCSPPNRLVDHGLRGGDRRLLRRCSLTRGRGRPC